MSSDTKLFGLLGYPLGHSMSPGMHGFLLEAIGQKGCYQPFERKKKQLARTVSALKELNFTGFNVTIPHKQNIIEHIDEVDHQARLIGAVNTVYNDGHKLVGYNTDCIGFFKAFVNKGIDLTGREVMVFGAGGAARGVLFSLLDNGVAKVVLLNRTLEHAENLARSVTTNYPQAEVIAMEMTQENITGNLNSVTCIVNTTSVGMWPGIDSAPFLFEEECGHLTVYDLVYNPLETRFLRSAKDSGATFIDGLDMFIFQGVAALEIWLQTKNLAFDYVALRNFLIGQLRKYE